MEKMGIEFEEAASYQPFAYILRIMLSASSSASIEIALSKDDAQKLFSLMQEAGF